MSCMGVLQILFVVMGWSTPFNIILCLYTKKIKIKKLKVWISKCVEKSYCCIKGSNYLFTLLVQDNYEWFFCVYYVLSPYI